MGQPRIVEVSELDPGERRQMIEHAYRELLEPAFPRNELDPFEDLLADVEASRGLMAVSCTDDGAPLGCVVAEWLPRSRCMLVAYLVVRADLRGQSLGTLLATSVIPRWAHERNAALVLGEVEDPAAFPPSEGQDPAGRLRLYHRLGALRIDTPYVQPQVRPDAERVPDMLLIVVPRLSASVHTTDGGDTVVPSSIVCDALVEHFAANEGAGHDDEQFRALLTAAGTRVEIPLVPLVAG